MLLVNLKWRPAILDPAPWKVGLPYDVFMLGLGQRVCRYIRNHELLRAGDRTGIAISGGADSVALFRLLLELREELGLVLSLVHVNHQIRGEEADKDQQFVAELAGKRGLPMHAFSTDTPAYATAHQLSLEAAAREVRYQHFRRLLADGVLEKVATAHTLDDQAETVLLRLARGTGITGLAGIYPKWPTSGAQFPERAIVRPLLQVRRKELHAYLDGLGQPWREDATNADLRFARNRVRQKLLPVLENELNPRVRERLAETADIARGEEDYWAAEVSRALALLWGGQGKSALRLSLLRGHPLALQRRLLRAAAESLGLKLEFIHVEELLELAKSSEGGEKQVVMPQGWRAVRSGDLLRLDPAAAGPPAARDFEYPLAVPGEVAVAETGTIIRATIGPISPEHAHDAYDPARLPGRVCVRNWRPGDRFWPAHTRASRKIKELLQERKIPLLQRRTWPVIASAGRDGEEIIWVRGFAPPQPLLAASGQHQGLTIQEYAFQGASHRAE
jgi:tRNA(Ile)-lysidine synthase